MDISITDISDVEKELQIQATAEELAPIFEKVYQKQRAKLEIKGFRKGKAPLDLVKKLHGEAIEYGSLDDVASDFYRQVVQERNIRPIGEPVLTDIDYKRGETLRFKVKYEVKPNVELKEYKGIPIEKLIHTVTDKEVDDEVTRLRRSNSTTTEVQQVTDDDHIVTVDVQQLDETGTPLIGKKLANVRVYLADEQVYPEIKQALKNAALGTTAHAKVEIKQNEQEQTNRLELTVKKIEKVELPAFDDEFVKKITKDKVTIADEFAKQLRTDLERYWHDRSERQMVDALIGEIVRQHDLTVPESMVRGVLDSMMEEYKNRFPNKKLPPDFNEQEFRDQNRGYAIFQAKWYLIRERIIETEGLIADEADMERQAEIDSPKMGIEKDRLLSFYKSSDAIKDRLVSEKLINLLKQQARVTERVAENSID
ncbi:MAG: trigger factor [Ignavibacteriae bacterium]|nr:trigger factor [Ignavibacteria bacterium]MBI3363282.1 trigger factor [Ignavibacteriota bacterium]